MPKQKVEKVNLYEARGANYVAHYEFRQYVLSLPKEVQEKYHSLSMVFPEWKLNNFGAVQINEDEENRLISLANQHGLQAWYLISIYTSDDGWNKFVGQFNELPPDESYPHLLYKKEDVIGLHGEIYEEVL